MFYREVAFADSGEYTCFARNKLGTAQGSGSLTVKGKSVNSTRDMKIGRNLAFRNLVLSKTDMSRCSSL